MEQKKCKDPVCTNLARKYGLYCNSCAQLKSRYGIERVGLNAWKNSQDSKCAFCGREKHLMIYRDNDGKALGMACKGCSTMLGQIRAYKRHPYFQSIVAASKL